MLHWVKWSRPLLREQFPIAPAETYSRVEVLFEGERRLVRSAQGERFVYGPWHVVLEVVTPGGDRRTIHQWVVRHRWTTEEVSIRIETPAILTRILGGERVTLEISGSEQRLSWEFCGSEGIQAGASERHRGGASEILLAGASELRAIGGAELLWLGASEIVSAGASELRWGGPGNLRVEGGSVVCLSGSIGGLPQGASEKRP